MKSSDDTSRLSLINQVDKSKGFYFLDDSSLFNMREIIPLDRYMRRTQEPEKAPGDGFREEDMPKSIFMPEDYTGYHLFGRPVAQETFLGIVDDISKRVSSEAEEIHRFLRQQGIE